LIAVLCLGVPAVIGGAPGTLRIALFLYSWLAFVAVTGGALFANRERLSEALPLILRHLEPRSVNDLTKEREGEALRLVKERRSIDPGFTLHNKNETLRLARCAAQWGERDLADALMRDC
jgi:hypothetical protein